MSRSLPKPFSIPECDRALVRELLRLLDAGGVSLIGLSGAKLEIPETLCTVFVSILALLVRGECLHLIVRQRAVTTEQAAWILGMSRQFVVKLLQGGSLPYHWVGNRRRIYIDDILEYVRQRDGERKPDT